MVLAFLSGSGTNADEKPLLGWQERKLNNMHTSTKPTDFEERAKIEAEVKMIKIGKDPSGRWIWKRSDRITPEDKKQRESMLEKIKKGLKV